MDPLRTPQAELPEEAHDPEQGPQQPEDPEDGIPHAGEREHSMPPPPPRSASQSRSVSRTPARRPVGTPRGLIKGATRELHGIQDADPAAMLPTPQGTPQDPGFPEEGVEEHVMPEEGFVETPDGLRRHDVVAPTPPWFTTPDSRMLRFAGGELPFTPAAGLVAASKGVTPAAKKTNDKKQRPQVLEMPLRLGKELFEHFAGTRIKPEVADAIHEAAEQHLRHLFGDAAAFARHAKRRTVDESDLECVFRRQRLVNSKVSMSDLIHKYLPREYVEELLPVVKADLNAPPPSMSVASGRPASLSSGDSGT